MSVQFIIGRAGTGKTESCLREALSADAAGGPQRLIMLTPEQASFQVERALLKRSARAALSRLEVLTFTRLAKRLLITSGQDRRLLSPARRQLALRMLIARSPQRYAVFNSVRDTPGLYARLEQSIVELFQECVDPDELSRKIRDAALGPRAEATAALYADYRAWLATHGLDPLDDQRIAAERVPQTDWLPGASIWVDGFAGFQARETILLVALARVAANVTITLLCDPSDPGQPVEIDPLECFQPARETLARLRTAFRAAGVKIAPDRRLTPESAPRYAAPALAWLERHWPHSEPSVTVSEEPSAAPIDAERVTVLECPTPREELRRCARWIRRKLAESRGALRCRDFALVFRDLSMHAALVEEIFSEYELPCFIDQRRALDSHALVRFASTMIDVVRGDFEPGAMARLLRSGLLPLDELQADQLERRLLEHQVRGARLWRGPSWRFDVPESPPPDDLAAARAAIVAALEPLLECVHDSSPVAQRWTAALESAIDALHVQRRVSEWIREERNRGRIETAEVHRLAWESLIECLRDLSETLHDHPLSPREFSQVLRAALRGRSVGLAPPTLDRVLISSIERSRHPEVRFVWLAAFNDGVFPRAPVSRGVLSDAQRDALAEHWPGLRGHADGILDERLLAYIAATRASDGLVISYSLTTLDGSAALPSPLLAELRTAAPWITLRTAREHLPPVGLRDFARLRIEAADGADPQAAADYAALEAELRGSLQHGAEVARLLSGRNWSNRTRALPHPFATADPSDPRLAWSGTPTQVTTYLDCPFRYFANHVLRLRVSRRPQPAAPQLGGAAHDVLAALLSGVIADGRSVQGMSDDEWLKRLDAAYEHWRQSQPRELARRQPGRDALLQALRVSLREITLAIAERYRRGLFSPLGSEVTFGSPRREEHAAETSQPRLPPLRIELLDGRYAEIHGRIDRIDRCRIGNADFDVVIDYKRRAETLKRRLVRADQFQLLLYAAALQDADQSDLGGGLIMPLWPLNNRTTRRKANELASHDERLKLTMPRGMICAGTANSWDNPQAPDSLVVALKRTKKGFHKTMSDVVDDEALAERVTLGRQLALHVIDGITKGDVSVSPLSYMSRLPCQYCDYRPACRFELGIDPARTQQQVLHAIGRGEDPDSEDEDS